MTAIMLGAFAAVLWLQHRNHQADWHEMLALLTTTTEEER